MALRRAKNTPATFLNRLVHFLLLQIMEIEYDVHQSLCRAWEGIDGYKATENEGLLSGNNRDIVTYDVPWDFRKSLNQFAAGKSQDAEWYRQSTVACYCVAYVETAKLLEKSAFESRSKAGVAGSAFRGFNGAEGSSCRHRQLARNQQGPQMSSFDSRPSLFGMIHLCKAQMEDALRCIAFWTRLGVSLKVKRLVDQARLHDDAEGKVNLNPLLFPGYLQLRWREMQSDSLPLLLISQ